MSQRMPAWPMLSVLLLAAPAAAQSGAVAGSKPAAQSTTQEDSGRQEPASSTRGTGIALHDRMIVDANHYASRYPQAFVAELNRYYAVAPEQITMLLRVDGVTPGNLLYACALAQAAVRPCAEVVQQWRQAPEQGWVAVGSAMEVTSGSAQGRRLDARLRATYTRWARPLPQASD